MPEWLETFDFIITYRFDFYILIAVLALLLFCPIYAKNLGCAQYIKAMVDQFLDGQDSQATAAGAKIADKRTTRAKTMRKKLSKQAKAARKVNRSSK